MRQTAADTRLVQIVLDTTRELGWWRDNCALADPVFTEALLEQLAHSRCLLKSLVDLSDSSSQLPTLTQSVRKSLIAWLHAGVSLHLEWPRDWSQSVERWVGPRFCLTTAANFSNRSRFASVACSQIGRHGCKLRSWPKLLDAALQHFHRHRDRPLLVDGTTLSQPLEQFVIRAPIQPLHVSVAKHASASLWLRELFARVQIVDHSSHSQELAQEFASELSDTLRISPAVAEVALPFESLPLQDRLTFALADHVMVLSVRDRGTISSLMTERLSDCAFPVASVFVATIANDSHAVPPVFQQWLPRGAVGWLIAESPSEREPRLTHCQRLSHQTKSVAPRSLASKLASHRAMNSRGHGTNTDEQKFLVHCTRGNLGPMPDESISNHIDRAWTLGELAESHPLLTLQQIVSEQRIVGNSRLTRTSQPCVSFSAVPLTELLQRRRFRSHLGRWDWEPYGVLIEQSVLTALGARPVIYGSTDLYEQLSVDDRPYFQPTGKRDKRTGLDWSSEEEWRLLGNLSLSQLPAEAVLLFVEYQQQAEQLARYSPWNVVWCKPS